MFSFRRKSKKAASEPSIRTSPSLPTLNSQGIPWPEELVDITAIREDPPEEEQQHGGGAKVSLQADRTPIPFHKPFRPSESSTRPQENGAGSISALYMTASGPPTFEPKKTWTTASLAGRYSQRRARIPPTFNLMVRDFPSCGIVCSKNNAFDRLRVARERAKRHSFVCCWKRRIYPQRRPWTRRRRWRTF